ncbi:MAG TPA: RDD family protein [Terriglobales bacterium]|jgi:uncharacterized RDD family membrane protein YckC|nr:RDD family protein [Terriglobales bacterium]
MATANTPMVCSVCAAPMLLAGKRLYGYSICEKCHSDFAMKRAFAYIVDMMIWSVVCFPLSIFIILLSGISGAVVETATHNNNSGANMAMLVFFVCILGSMFLVLAMDGFKGHSPAKAMFGLQVIDDLTGRPINFWDSFQRNLPLAVPFMPLYAAFQIFQHDGRRMGDGWARTKVIWKPYRDKSPFLSRKQLQAQLSAKAAGKISV